MSACRCEGGCEREADSGPLCRDCLKSDCLPYYPSRLPSGEWRCIRDGRTEPCGDCTGCREVQAENAANESLAAAAHAQPSLSVTATNLPSTASPIATDTPSALREKTK